MVQSLFLLSSKRRNRKLSTSLIQTPNQENFRSARVFSHPLSLSRVSVKIGILLKGWCTEQADLRARKVMVLCFDLNGGVKMVVVRWWGSVPAFSGSSLCFEFLKKTTFIETGSICWCVNFRNFVTCQNRGGFYFGLTV